MINTNSEILFLYDAQMCNPNGDMDNENKPRMDHHTQTNLVSDVRLKRYIRDYFEDIKGQEIFISSKAKDAKERNTQIKKIGKDHKDLIDVRYFGAVTAEDTVGSHYTGPIQFNWGYSLHPVEIVDSSTITSSFSSGQGIGKDYRLYYSLIAFAGTINANASAGTQLTEEDVTLFDEAILQAIPLARTRTKIGQYPRLYLRIELVDKKSFMKDLRTLVTVESASKSTETDLGSIRKPDDYSLNIDALISYLEMNKAKILKIHYWKDEQISIPRFDEIFIVENWKTPLSL